MEESFLKVGSSCKNYYLRIKYNNKDENLISVDAVDGAHSWYGEVSKAEIEDQAVSAEKTYDEFLLETRCALLFEKSMSKQFTHSVEVENGHLKWPAMYHVDERIELNQKRNENKKERSYLYKRIQRTAVSTEIDPAALKSLSQKREFTWKLVLDHGIKFQLGTAKLLENEEKDIGSFLDAAICQFSKMKEEISTLSTAKENLLNEREKTLKRLEEFASAKEQLEADLYEKFLAVLNEKKAKIRQLKKTCESLKDGQVARFIGDASTRPKIKSNHESSEEDEDTDMEEEKKAQNSKKESSVHKMPKIIGAEKEEEDEEMTVAAKRKRSTKRKSSSRASVIPRTSSLPRPLSKQKSGGSDMSPLLNQSSENLDKLVENM